MTNATTTLPAIDAAVAAALLPTMRSKMSAADHAMATALSEPTVLVVHGPRQATAVIGAIASRVAGVPVVGADSHRYERDLVTVIEMPAAGVEHVLSRMSSVNRQGTAIVLADRAVADSRAVNVDAAGIPADVLLARLAAAGDVVSEDVQLAVHLLDTRTIKRVLETATSNAIQAGADRATATRRAVISLAISVTRGGRYLSETAPDLSLGQPARSI